MNIDTELQDYEAAGSLAEELPYWGWLDDERTCLTRAGELMSLARISLFVLDGQTPAQLDRVIDRWQRMLSGLDGDIRRIFASHDAKVIREGYGQLPAWFSRMPGQPRRRQVRSVFVSAGVAACMAPIFGPPVGTPQSAHLRAEALAILETG